MFERYTESARRVLFFARYEASRRGAVTIHTEHVLLGLIRESRGIVARVFVHFQVSVGDIRASIEQQAVRGEYVSTSVEMPFEADTKQALVFAAEEADRLRHDYIGTEHVLLALLRQETTVAGSILAERGLRLEDVRTKIVDWLGAPATGSIRGLQGARQLLDDIERLVHQLSRAPAGSAQATQLTEAIESHLATLRRHLTG